MAGRSQGEAAVNRLPMKIIILGLSITSSWGNGHATTYRSLVRALAKRGNDVLFLERDMPWYSENRDLPNPCFGRTELYRSVGELKEKYTEAARNSDLIMVGSYVPEGVEVGNWAISSSGGVAAFYDIDTPVTLAKLERGTAEYINKDLIGRYDLYLSFTGGPTPRLIEKKYRSPMARVLYCSVDPDCYYPEPEAPRNWDLGYLGTYSEDRQPKLDNLMFEPARRWPKARMVVAGALYPSGLNWPKSVHAIMHLAPAEHRRFYNSQRFTLNVTRADMVHAGYSPSVRLFEAAACATPIISDWWDGLDSVLEIGSEILVARHPEDTLHYLRDMDEQERRSIGERARARVLQRHTSDHRASELESYIRELGAGPR
jgi:spore maturation protein CgeB